MLQNIYFILWSILTSTFFIIIHTIKTPTMHFYCDFSTYFFEHEFFSHTHTHTHILVCKLSKFSYSFTFISSSITTLLIIFHIHYYFHVTFMLDKWGRIKQPYTLPNHQQNKRCQHLQWTKPSIFSPLARWKDAKNKNMVLKLKQNSCNQKTNLHVKF